MYFRKTQRMNVMWSLWWTPDELKLPIVEVKLKNADRSTWNAARRAAADQPCGRNMLNLCVPFSTEKIKDIVRGCTTMISFRRALIYGGPILFMQYVVCPFAWLLLSDSYFKLPTE